MCGEFKAISAGIRRILRVEMQVGTDSNLRLVAQAPHTHREDAGDFAEAFVGSQVQGISAGSHGTSFEGSAHSDLRLETSWLSGGIQVGGARPPLYLLITR